MKSRTILLSLCLPLFLGCSKEEGEVYLPPQPSGMEDAIYSAAGMLAALKSNDVEIPSHWGVPSLIVNRNPSPDEVKEAIASDSPQNLAALLRKYKKRHILLERGIVEKLSAFGRKIALGRRLDGFSYFGLDKKFVLITIEHEKPNLDGDDLKNLFAFARKCLGKDGEIAVAEAGERLNRKFYTELSLSLFEGGRRENWLQKKSDSPASAIYELCKTFVEQHEKAEKKKPVNASAPMIIDFFYGHAHFEDPDKKLLDEFLSPGESGLAIRRYIPLKDGKYKRGFYFFMLPIIFNLREIKEGHKLAERLCKESAGENDCYRERANIMKRFETLTYLQLMPGGDVVELKRGRVPQKVALTKKSVSKALSGLFECSLRFLDDNGNATLYIDQLGLRSPKNLPPERLAHFYAPLLRAVALYEKGWEERISGNISKLPSEIQTKIFEFAAARETEKKKYSLYDAQTAPTEELIGGIEGDKWRGAESFSAARFWRWVRQFEGHSPPKEELDRAAEFILYWLTTKESVGFRLPEKSLKSLGGCIARSPTVLLSNPQDQAAAAYILALWLEKNK
ncbi:MAG: hypothetical protein Kow0090_14530 [Myxococcota bacterium]